MRDRPPIRHLLFALILTSAALTSLGLTACGSQPPRPTADAGPGPDTGGELPPDAPEGGANQATQQADEAEVLRQLEAAQGADRPRLIQALPAKVLKRLLPRMTPSARGWAHLRLSRLAFHTGRHRAGASALAEARATLQQGGARQDAALKRAIEWTAARQGALVEPRQGRLGVLLPLSGPFGAIGEAALEGIKIAAAESGLAIEVKDTAGDADQAARAVESLVYEHRVMGILGPVGVKESRAAALTAQRLGVPLMTLSAGEGLTRLGGWIFRHRLTRTAEARAVAQYAVKQMGLTRFAILYPETDYGRAMMKAFWRTVERLGGEVRGAEGYGPNTTRFDRPIKALVGRVHLGGRRKDPHWKQLNAKIKDRAMHYAPIVDFEGLFIPDGGQRLRMLLPFLAYHDLELKLSPDMNARALRPKYNGKTPQLVQVLGGSGFNNARLAERALPHIQNAAFIDLQRREDEQAVRFSRAYERATGRPPGALAAHAFDAALIFSHVLGQAADRADLRRRLLEVRDFEGVMGPTSIDGEGEARFELYMLTVNPEGFIVPRYEE